MPDFFIRVANDDLLFSASHFITFEGGGCEALHGHDYQVAAELHGPLNANQYVIDFVILHDVIKNILNELDHRTLLPLNHPRIDIRTIGDELEVAFGPRRWVLPKDDCVLLPISNSTGEMLAQYLAGRISKELSGGPKGIKVEVREGNGFTAIYQLGGDE